MRRKKKSNSSNNKLQLEYAGNVTVSIVRNGEIIRKIDGHNNGTYRLFEFIARCLASRYDGNLAPRFLQIFHATSSSDTNISDKQSLIGIVAASSTTFNPDAENNLAEASLTFTIPGEIFNDIENVPNLFALYSQADRLNKDSPLATYYLDGGLGAIASDTNVIVVWELTIGNRQ